MTRGRVMYLCSGRSFYSARLGRKVSSVAECWRNAGYEVKQVCGGDISQSHVSALKEYGAASFHRRWYRRIGILDPLIKTLSEKRDIQHDAAMVRHLEQVCKSFKPDLIWERSCRLHCAGLVMAKRLGVPYVLEWKDNIASYWLSWYRNRALAMERRKNDEADFIVTESEVLRDLLIRDGVDGAKIIAAQNATDSGKFRRDPEAGMLARMKFDVAPETVLVGYLGSYAWYHDTARLVKAMDILRERGCENVRCLMVGAGKEYDGTRRLAQKCGLLGNGVIMKPGVPKDEVPGILAALDIAVLPGSTDIICPIKIQEYMACELPSVVPDYACNREVLHDGETGLLFMPKDENALANKILHLVGNQNLRETMGKRAREEVLCRFSWEATWGSALETVMEDSYGKLSRLDKRIAD